MTRNTTLIWRSYLAAETALSMHVKSILLLCACIYTAVQYVLLCAQMQAYVKNHFGHDLSGDAFLSTWLWNNSIDPAEGQWQC